MAVDVGKLVTNPKMLLGTVITTAVSLFVINSIAKRVPQVGRIVGGI